ncbi:MAG: 50S ribosomal protein L1 [Candidatus Omnitrophica bacterium]|nr:50S ribosomal protein L1 [Candidatus Omnitrophota bacterium]
MKIVRSKRYKEAAKLVDAKKIYSVEEAITILKNMPAPKFDETLEISCKLQLDPKQTDQLVRGSVVLPKGTGKTIKIAVFCEPEKESAAQASGADQIGGQDLISEITKSGTFSFDYCIATPAMMKFVSRLGKILGPKGLMPSPKNGTVTDNIAHAVKEAKRGKIDFRMDKFSCIHVGLGKLSFSKEALIENTRAFLEALVNTRASTVKGDFIKTMFLSRSMSPSLRITL